jgi:hypothetical protein
MLAGASADAQHMALATLCSILGGISSGRAFASDVIADPVLPAWRLAEHVAESDGPVPVAEGRLGQHRIGQSRAAQRRKLHLASQFPDRKSGA